MAITPEDQKTDPNGGDSGTNLISPFTRLRFPRVSRRMFSKEQFDIHQRALAQRKSANEESIGIVTWLFQKIFKRKD